MAYTPEFPYKGEQIIINSGRVFINSRDDSAFLNASKAISLGSGGTINFDSADKCIVNSPRIDLGLGALHPVAKGDILVRILERIGDELEKSGNLMKTFTDSHGVKIVQAGPAAQKLIKIKDYIKTEIKILNSEITFTK